MGGMNRTGLKVVGWGAIFLAILCSCIAIYLTFSRKFPFDYEFFLSLGFGFSLLGKGVLTRLRHSNSN
jgi:hypothetical protein